MRAASILLFLPINCIFAMRILAYFPSVAKSHHFIAQPIIHELANRGHHILYATPIPPSQSHPNISVVPTMNYWPLAFDHYGDDFLMKMTALNNAYMMDDFAIYLVPHLCKSKEIQQLIHSNDSYDLVFHSALLSQEHALAFAHKFKAQSVALQPFGDTTWLNEMSGLTDNPAYMMGHQVALSDRMNFLERVYNTVIKGVTLITAYYYLYKLQTIVDDHFIYNGSDTRPSIFQLARDHSLILTASHHALGYPFPKAPHVKEIGGLSLKESKPLPEEFESFVSTATDGFVYFSFGSLVKTKDIAHLQDVFLNVFKRLKQKVLLKWDTPIDNLPNNVMVSKWFPQQDVLGHKNIKLFVTHGGLQSSFETVYHQVPIVSIPFFSDQRKNSKLAESAGFGVMLLMENVTEESFFWAVSEVLGNPRYKNEAKRRSALLHDRPMTPLNEAVYWIEYIHRHGRVSQPASVHLSVVQFYLMDVYAFVVASVILMFVIMKYLIRLFWGKIKVKSRCSASKSSKKIE